MTSNSMKQFITPSYVVGKVKMLLGEKRIRNPDKLTIILVEGSSDQKMLGLFANTQNCLIVVAEGKNNAIEALKLLSAQRERGIVAFVDNDFDTLTGRTITHNNVIISDLHDMETMIISSPALRKYIGLLLPPHKNDKIDKFTEEVKNILIRITHPLGCLRWVTIENNCRLSLKKIPLEELIDFAQYKLRLDDLVELRCKTKSTEDMCGKENLIKLVEEKRTTSLNPWLVCQGHDLIRVLFVILPKLLPGYFSARTEEQKERLNKTILEKIGSDHLIFDWLLGCYEADSFKGTQMYKQIKEWETRNSPYKILRYEYT